MQDLHLPIILSLPYHTLSQASCELPTPLKFMFLHWLASRLGARGICLGPALPPT